jgi:hypothetical protein
VYWLLESQGPSVVGNWNRNGGWTVLLMDQIIFFLFLTVALGHFYN